MSEEAGVAAQIAELVQLGRSFLEAGRLTEAEDIFQGLRAVVPNDVEVNKQLGIVLATRGAYAQAIGPLADAAALDDRDPVLFNVLGACAFETGDDAAALDACDRALALNPSYPEAHNNRGNALLRLGRPEEAAGALRAALRFTPHDAELHLNLGNALEGMGDLDAALQSLDRALALAPRLLPGHVNRGNILQKLGRHGEALQAYDRALALDPGHFDAHWNRALCHLLLGDFEAGWVGYEWRWRRPGIEPDKAARPFPQPLWLGREPLEGRTILLHGEQGLGDTIQFARYIPMVAARGARIVLEVFAPLAPLMAGQDSSWQVVRRGDPLPPFDLHCPLMSLPLALGAPEPLWPAQPYLKADPDRMHLWAGRLGPARALRVGLVCSGSSTHGGDALRSVPFEALSAALPPGPDYHLLQKDVREADRAALAHRADITVWAQALADFSDTAALCAHMDLVVSVDTSVAHLAGALGRPVWMLVPFDPDWRWGLHGGTTPWYPQMRLYRQAGRGRWDDVLERVARDLLAVTAG